MSPENFTQSARRQRLSAKIKGREGLYNKTSQRKRKRPNAEE